MMYITVSDDVARQLAEASQPVVLVDNRGRELGQVTSLNTAPARAGSRRGSNDNEWAEAKLRMEQAKREGGPFYTTKEVLDHLKSLERE